MAARERVAMLSRMVEGWAGEDHFVVFDSDESQERTRVYKLDEYLPGYHIVGLKGWDEFVVLNSKGEAFTVPTVPLHEQYLSPCVLPSGLAPDERFANRIKWYVTPLAFGGSPTDASNTVWITHEEHAGFVNFWNDKARYAQGR